MSTSPDLTFVLRQFLTTDTFEKRLTELICYCAEWSIDEVLLFPHPLGIHDTPTGFWLDHEIERDRKLLLMARKRLTDAGIRMGLNIFHTIGHGDRGQKMDSPFSFQPLVSHTGSASLANACPLDEKWREYYRKCLRAYASIEPCTIFIDDDFRWQNHGQISGNGFFNCFCPLHLHAFNKLYGTNYDRPSLVSNIVRTGSPHVSRQQWLSLLDRQLIDLARDIEQTIHSVSPETEIGLMSGTADQMCQEGRSWRMLLQTLAGPKRRMLYRPCYPDYVELPPKELPDAISICRQLVSEVPRESVIFAEIDNCMPTEFNHSPTSMCLRIVLAALCGIRNFHLSLFDFNGNEDTFSGQAEYGEMLPTLRRSLRPILENLEGNPIAHGIQLPLNPHRVIAKETKEGKDLMELLVNSLSWSKGLQLAGFPITFDSSWVVALTETSVRGLPSEQLKNLLSQTALLDGSAVQWLTARELGNWIGVNKFQEYPPSTHRITSEENIAASDPFCGAHYYHHPLHPILPEFCWELDPRADVFTSFAGRGNASYGAGEFRFKNELGGTIFGIPLASRAVGTSAFLTRYRLRLLCEELSRQAIEAKAPFCFVEGQPNVLPLHLQYNSRHLLACLNLHTERANTLRFQCHSIPVISKAWLWYEKELTPVSFDIHKTNTSELFTVEIPTSIPHLGICILMT